jgi:hypothetical protein
MEIIYAPKPPTTGGAKLNRSETVTVRFDPKLNYLCELAARAQRRTKSSFIEWAVAESLKSVNLPEVFEHVDFDEYRPATLQERSSALWHIDEPDRLVALAFNAPALLTHEEQVIWKFVRENGYLWRGQFKKGEWKWNVDEDSLTKDRLRQYWSKFVAVARGEASEDALPSWTKTTDIDEDVPF